jgi:hypothetical protein
MFKDERRDFTSEEIVSVLLEKMKEIAENYFDRQS